MNVQNTCDKCEKTFKYKYLMIRHQNKKNDCGDIKYIKKNISKTIDKISENINNLQLKLSTYEIDSIESNKTCKFCEKNLSTKSNLKKHIKYFCSNKKILIEELDNLILEKQKYVDKLNDYNNNIEITNKNLELNNKDLEIAKLKEELDKYKHNKNINNINNNNNNTYNITINNNENIQINSFGKEDLSHITEDDYKKFISKCKDGLIDYIDKVYFSDINPSNRNLYLSSMKSKYMTIFDKSKWNLVLKKETLDKIVSSKNRDLNNKCDKFAESGELDEDYIDCYKQFRRDYIDDNNNLEEYLREAVGLLLFNNKNKVNISNSDNKIIT
jgi:hypothetical protein